MIKVIQTCLNFFFSEISGLKTKIKKKKKRKYESDDKLK